MRTRWSWLFALAAALGVVLRGIWQWRGMHPGAQQGAIDGERPRARSGGASPSDVPSMTKAELYEEAKRLDIPGRSAMGKAELARAIRRARH